MVALDVESGLDAPGWAQQEFGDCELGDPRRTRRLVKIVGDQAAQPSGSYSQAAGGNRHDLKGYYRFLNSGRQELDPERLLQTHRTQTIRRMKKEPPVRCVAFLGQAHAYRARASFFNATARTADGYLGLLFRRPPFIKVPEGANGLGKAMRAFINDADMLGTSLANYARNVAREVIGVGRAGTLIDWEGQSENRVYASLYTAENMLNWRVERIHGRNVLTLLVLHEAVRNIGEEELGGAPGVHVNFK